MTRRRDYIWHTGLTLVASVILHSAGYLQFYFSEEHLLLPAYWTWQVLFVVAGSTIISMVLPLVRRQLLLVLLIALRCWFLIILGLPMSNSIGLQLSMALALILDATRYLVLPLDIGASVFVLAASLASQVSIQSWKVAVEPISIDNRIALILYPAILATVILVMKIEIHILLGQKEQADKARRANLELSNINLALQEHSLVAEENARLDERVRISHELHDTVGYALTNQRMMMEAAIRQCSNDQGDLSELLEQALSQARESLREMKYAMRELQDVDRTRGNGIENLVKLVKAFEKTSITVSIDFRNLHGSIHPEIDEIIYRVVQEGITNAIQHGIASTIQISLWQGEHEVSVAVIDDGIGCNEISEGVGLKGMRERLEAIGGSVKAANIPGGFIITTRIPFQA